MVQNASTSTIRRWEWWTRLAKRLQGAGLWVELTRNLASRDVETRYKHSLLGLYWAIINPLVTAAIFGFVFGVIFHVSPSENKKSMKRARTAAVGSTIRGK